jgi:hypothetical protein
MCTSVNKFETNNMSAPQTTAALMNQSNIIANSNHNSIIKNFDTSF